jgi:hypothetical protein
LRSLAFQHWAFNFSRNAAETARFLLEGWSPDSWGPKPELAHFTRAIQKWSIVEEWPAKVRHAIAAVAPDIDTQIIVNNMANALKASVVMGEVLDGRYNASEGRTRAYAAQIAFNHAGYDPASMLERIKEASANRGAEFNPAALAQLSPDELAERADRIRRGLPIDLPIAVSSGADVGSGQVVTHPSVPTCAREDQATDDISQHQTHVDTSDASPPDAEHTPPVAASEASPTSPNADGRDSSRQV